MTRNKVEASTLGQARKAMYMKVSSREANVMEKVLFGGLMAVGIREILEMECNQVGEYCIVKVDTDNTREIGIMVCLTVEGLNISRTANDMRAHSRRTNSMARAYSTRTIP